MPRENPLKEALDLVIIAKVKAARIHLAFAIAFAVTFIGFCAGGVFFAAKMGAVAFGFACTISAMLVLALLSSSRSLGAEAARLRILATDLGGDARASILKELTAVQSDGATTTLQTLREAIVNKRLK